MRNILSLPFLMLLFVGTSQAFKESKIYSTGMTEDKLNRVLVAHEHVIMDPPILANLDRDGGTNRIVSLFVAIKYEKNFRHIEYHEALIRDRIIKLLNTKTASFLKTRRGQRLTIFQLTQLLRKTLFEEEGEPVVTDIEIIELIIE